MPLLLVINYTLYLLQAQFFFSTVWSIGATCDQDGRTKFDGFFKDLSLGKLDKFPMPKCIGKNDLPFPNEHTIYDFMYDVSALLVSPVGLCFIIHIYKQLAACW